MPRNGSGTYTLPQAAFVPNTTISSANVNSDFSDIASALTASVSSDGQTTITGQLKFPSGTVAAPGITFGSDLTTGLYYPGANQINVGAGGVGALNVNTANIGVGQNGAILNYVNGAILVPVGVIHDFAGSTAPSGWLLCAGQVIAQATYPELFTVIGSTYNTGGEGAGNYRLPDCRGRGTYGKDNMGGSAANRITVAGGNFDGTGLGNNGGLQNVTVGQANLPNINVTATSSFTGNQQTVNTNDNVSKTLATFGAGAFNGGANPTAPTSVTFTPTGSVTTTMAWPNIGQPGGTTNMGSGTALGSMNPAIIFNKIIFAGRP